MNAARGRLLPGEVVSFFAADPQVVTQRYLPERRYRAHSPYPLQSAAMFAAYTFALTIAPAALAGVAARATITKTTTIKG